MNKNVIEPFDPITENLYKNIVEYFGNPILTKLKNVNGYTMYIAKIYANLGVEHRYLIVFIHQDNENIGTQEKLSNLRWVSLQTRALTDDHKLTYHAYTPRRLPGLDKKITLVEYDGKSYKYKVEDLPLTVSLLPTKKNTGVEYNASGSVVTALETYNTILTLIT